MPSTISSITIASCDGQELIRKSLCELISSFGNFQVTIQAGNGNHFIQQLEQANEFPDICILDVQMRPLNGWDTVAEIKKRWPTANILILTGLNAEEIVDNLIRYKVDGFLCKSCSAEQLNNALTDVYENGSHFNQSVLKMIHQRSRRNEKPISRKEQEFLTYCVEDITLVEIAGKMNVSPRTVDNYRDSLYQKLKVKTRIGLTLFAIKSGLVVL